MNDGKHVPDSMIGIACEKIGRNRKRLEVRRLKKVVGISTGIVGVLCIIIGGIMKAKENTAVSIIGGADGPTSIFLAGKLNGNAAILLMVAGIVVLAAGGFAWLKRKH